MQGELGASFPLKLEAQHVIPARQLHVEALAELGQGFESQRTFRKRVRGVYVEENKRRVTHRGKAFTA